MTEVKSLAEQVKHFHINAEKKGVTFSKWYVHPENSKWLVHEVEVDPKDLPEMGFTSEESRFKETGELLSLGALQTLSSINEYHYLPAFFDVFKNKWTLRIVTGGFEHLPKRQVKFFDTLSKHERSLAEIEKGLNEEFEVLIPKVSINEIKPQGEHILRINEKKGHLQLRVTGKNLEGELADLGTETPCNSKSRRALEFLGLASPKTGVPYLHKEDEATYLRLDLNVKTHKRLFDLYKRKVSLLKSMRDLRAQLKKQG